MIIDYNIIKLLLNSLIVSTIYLYTFYEKKSYYYLVPLILYINLRIFWLFLIPLL
jgi:hypothetical protein